MRTVFALSVNTSHLFFAIMSRTQALLTYLQDSTTTENPVCLESFDYV